MNSTSVTLFGTFIWIWSFTALETEIQHQLLFFVTLYSHFICGWSLPLQSLSEHQTGGLSVDRKWCVPGGLSAKRHQHIMASSICCLCLCVSITVICRTLMPLWFPLIRPEKTHQMADGKNKSCLFQRERVHHPQPWLSSERFKAFRANLNTQSHTRKDVARSLLSCINCVTFQEMTDSRR